jgi:hypothetical protein
MIIYSGAFGAEASSVSAARGTPQRDRLDFPAMPPHVSNKLMKHKITKSGRSSPFYPPPQIDRCFPHRYNHDRNIGIACGTTPGVPRYCCANLSIGIPRCPSVASWVARRPFNSQNLISCIFWVPRGTFSQACRSHGNPPRMCSAGTSKNAGAEILKIVWPAGHPRGHTGTCWEIGLLPRPSLALIDAFSFIRA